MKRTLLLLLASGLLPAAAQDLQWQVGLTATHALDSLKKVTHASRGFGLSAGFQSNIPGTEVGARISLNRLSFPGNQHGTVKSSLALTQLAGDVLVAMPHPKFKAVVGFSLNKYSVDNQGTELLVPEPDPTQGTPKPLRPIYVHAVKDTGGTKMGVRLGMDIAWNRSWTTEVILQQTDLSGASYTKPATGVQGYTNVGAINPGWLQVTMRYTF